MIELTLERTKELLREVVAEKGEDFVYTNPDGEYGEPGERANCFYVHGDQGGCLVGHVLNRAGVKLDVLRDCETTSADAVIRDLVRRRRLEADMGVGGLLRRVQDYQDQGVAWGEALRRALLD